METALADTQARFQQERIALSPGSFGLATDTMTVFLGTRAGNIILGHALTGPWPDLPADGEVRFNHTAQQLQVFHDRQWFTYQVVPTSRP